MAAQDKSIFQLFYGYLVSPRRSDKKFHLVRSFVYDLELRNAK